MCGLVAASTDVSRRPHSTPWWPHGCPAVAPRPPPRPKISPEAAKLAGSEGADPPRTRHGLYVQHYEPHLCLRQCWGSIIGHTDT